MDKRHAIAAHMAYCHCHPENLNPKLANLEQSIYFYKNISRESVGEKRVVCERNNGRLELKDRKNVLNLYLNPAITEGYIRLLYPDSPRHPRQKYLLTVKGMALYNELKML